MASATVTVRFKDKDLGGGARLQSWTTGRLISAPVDGFFVHLASAGDKERYEGKGEDSFRNHIGGLGKMKPLKYLMMPDAHRDSPCTDSVNKVDTGG